MKIRRVCAMAVAISAAATSLIALPSTAQADSAQCVYTPLLPARVVVDQSVVGMKTQARISDSTAVGGCSENYLASEHLVHGADSYYLSYSDSNPSDAESIYAYSVVPGTYKTTSDTSCFSDSADYSTSYTCDVGAAQTVIKFAGHTDLVISRLTGKRKNLVRIGVTARHYTDYGRAYVTAGVAIQQLKSGSWVTIHRMTTLGSRGATWTHNAPKSGRYRVLQSETASSFASVSRSATK